MIQSAKQRTHKHDTALAKQLLAGRDGAAEKTRQDVVSQDLAIWRSLYPNPERSPAKYGAAKHGVVKSGGTKKSTKPRVSTRACAGVTGSKVKSRKAGRSMKPPQSRASRRSASASPNPSVSHPSGSPSIGAPQASLATSFDKVYGDRPRAVVSDFLSTARVAAENEHISRALEYLTAASAVLLILAAVVYL